MLVYMLTNKVNGKRYIGVTGETLHKRWVGHCNHAFGRWRKAALQYAIRKYGKAAFEMKLLYEAVDAREARKVERGMIAQYGTMVPNGYNMTSGGEQEVGHKHSPETREKLRQSAKKNVTPEFIAMAANGLGRPCSESTKQKISAANTGKPKMALRGRPFSDERKRRISKALKVAHAEGRMPKRIGGHYTTSEETKKKIGAKTLERLADPIYRKKAYDSTKRKLADREVATVKRLLIDGARTCDLARMFNVSQQLISLIRTGKKRATVAPEILKEKDNA